MQSTVRDGNAKRMTLPQKVDEYGSLPVSKVHVIVDRGVGSRADAHEIGDTDATKASETEAMGAKRVVVLLNSSMTEETVLALSTRGLQ